MSEKPYSGARSYTMRSPCSACGCGDGVVQRKGLQDVVRCAKCGRACYNAPRTETGERPVTVSTTHNELKEASR
jgi:uncharacterized Zn finger protein